VGQSPIWMQQKLKAIGLRPINNIVDITNFVLHETGQPLHAFDTEKIEGKKLFVKFLPEGTGFTGLDEKVRKLSKEDVMICNENAPMCIGGVFGGLESGVGINTRSVFLESAVFNPVAIRKSALRHDLRTDAANRFEKGVDISNTLQVLKRAALLICEIAGGTIGSAVTDIYPEPKEKLKLGIKYHYLKKLSGKNYHPETVKNILQHLNFEIDKDGIDELTVLVPHYKTDISIPADLVEEIMRIDGLDNIEIPKTISITASTGSNKTDEKLKEKVAGMLVGTGLQEIFTNSITNSAFIGEAQKTTMVKMVNNLSAELDVLRTRMLETGLQAIAYNINRKHTDLQFFEFGRTYSATATGVYHEKEHLAIYISGNKNPVHWGQPTAEADFYFTKMILEKILHTCGLAFVAVASPQNNAGTGLDYLVNQEKIGSVLQLHAETLQQFSIKSNVWHIDIDWSAVCKQIDKKELIYREVSKFPVSERDLAILVQKETRYSEIELAIRKSGVKKLLDFSLFDMFENEKLGIGKKSMAIRFTFGDPEKTLTDKEVEGFIQKILASLEKDLAAVLRT
jgi:phenylalanyl-tRNA synthetase beta chain